MINLRPHHVFCILNFVGEGYDDAFTCNMRAIVAAVAKERVTIVDKDDDICSCCPHNKSGDCTEKCHRYDESARTLLSIEANTQYDWYEVVRKAKIAMAQMLTYCKDCQWHSLCIGGQR